MEDTPESLRDRIIEEIMDALALGDLGIQSDAYAIQRSSDGSIVAEFFDQDQIYVISVVSRERGISAE
ncbi:hypothetical protein ACQP1K_00765 [Sphaerimonospora sp. CA-214678]|uniref:hypothetical protein n=1 Tax=Sphaerimonospora sp. CA-214678 TaxID=3240029 RepID=UPI003D8C7EB7